MIGWSDLRDAMRNTVEAIGVPATAMIGVLVVLFMNWVPFSTPASVLEAYSVQMLEHQVQANEQYRLLVAQQEKHYERLYTVLKAICFNTAAYDKILTRECSKL